MAWSPARTSGLSMGQATSTRRVVVQLPRGNRKHLYLSVDGGKAIRLTGGERVEITRSRYKTQLVQLSGRSFYEIINQKLGGYTP